MSLTIFSIIVNIIYFEIHIILANQAGKNLMSIMSPIWTFYVTQSFLSPDLFGFQSLGYPGVQGLGWRGHACVKNIP